MSTKTRAEAHKHFGSLYRKQRSEEHQKKVDEILAKTSDIFIRIDLIEKLDKEYFNHKRYDLIEDEPKDKEGKKTSSKQNLQKPSKESEEKTQTNTNNTSGGGLLGGLFGSGGTNEISKFAKDTKALEMSLITRKPSISPEVQKVFRGLNEDRIISVITTLNYCEKVGWKYWNHRTYNVIMNFKRFFTSFISLDSLFIDEISPEVFLEKSIKMQMYYIRHLEFPESSDIIMSNLPVLIQKSKSLSQKRTFIMEGLKYGLNLEKRNPKLTDCICAFHIIKNKKMVHWNDVKKMLKVPAIETNRFTAPPTVDSQIKLAVRSVKSKIREKLEVLKDADEIKTRYFQFDESGKMKYDFLYTITDDYLKSFHSEPHKVIEIRKSYLTNPHKLLHLLCRDLQSTYFGLIEGYIKIENTDSIDTLIFNKDLFHTEMEQINYLIRNLDEFNRKYSSFQYSFKAFTKHMAKGSSSNDQIEDDVLKLISKISKVFTLLGRKCNVILNNHMDAMESPEQEALMTEKNDPIENFKIQPRYIPYHDSKVKTDGRVNGYTIQQLFMEMTKLFLNYAAIFRESSIMQEISANKKMQRELNSHYAEYKRLTGFDYIPIEEDLEEAPAEEKKEPEKKVEETSEEKEESEKKVEEKKEEKS
ncbi:MAG: hypothetical protein AAF518_06060 [Spirochaetota bacterium]